MKEWKPNPEMKGLSSSVMLEDIVYVHGMEKAHQRLVESRKRVSWIEIEMGCVA